MFYLVVLSALASDPQPPAADSSAGQHPVETLDQIEVSMDAVLDTQAETLALLMALLEEKKLEGPKTPKTPKTPDEPEVAEPEIEPKKTD